MSSVTQPCKELINLTHLSTYFRLPNVITSATRRNYVTLSIFTKVHCGRWYRTKCSGEIAIKAYCYAVRWNPNHRFHEHKSMNKSTSRAIYTQLKQTDFTVCLITADLRLTSGSTVYPFLEAVQPHPPSTSHNRCTLTTPPRKMHMYIITTCKHLLQPAQLHTMLALSDLA